MHTIRSSIVCYCIEAYLGPQGHGQAGQQHTGCRHQHSLWHPCATEKLCTHSALAQRYKAAASPDVCQPDQALFWGLAEAPPEEGA